MVNKEELLLTFLDKVIEKPEEFNIRGKYYGLIVENKQISLSLFDDVLSLFHTDKTGVLNWEDSKEIKISKYNLEKYNSLKNKINKISEELMLSFTDEFIKEFIEETEDLNKSLIDLYVEQLYLRKIKVGWFDLSDNIEFGYDYDNRLHVHNKTNNSLIYFDLDYLDLEYLKEKLSEANKFILNNKRDFSVKHFNEKYNWIENFIKD